MKNISLILVIAFIVASCNNTGNKNEAALIDTLADSSSIPRTPNAHALCFLRIDGNNNQDTTSIELVIKDNKVTGLMNWMPYQKDSRKGKLQGTIKNDSIQAVWSFMQEGMVDTINLQFKLQNNNLLQKPLKVDPKNGRQQTDEAADYTLAYRTSDKIYK